MIPIVYEEIKWEYRIVNGAMTIERLNEMGQDGWELAGVGSAENKTAFYFKRPA